MAKKLSSAQKGALVVVGAAVAYYAYKKMTTRMESFDNDFNVPASSEVDEFVTPEDDEFTVPESSDVRREGYTDVHSSQNVGAASGLCGSAPEMQSTYTPSPQETAYAIRGSSDVIPYNIDTATNMKHRYHMGLGLTDSMLAVRSPLKDYSLNQVIRGDIPIASHPDIPLVGVSRFGEDGHTKGVYSKAFADQFASFTGTQYRNTPQYTAGNGMYGSGAVIMDSY